MAFPTNSGSRGFVQAEAWQASRSTATLVKTRSKALRDASAAGPISAKDVLDLSTTLADAADVLEQCAAVPGMQDYIRDQLNDPAYEATADFTAMLTEVQETVTWIVNNFPAAGGFIQSMTLPADGRYAYRTLTTAQLSGLRAQLDALLATID